jgi:hypothetical protein
VGSEHLGANKRLGIRRMQGLGTRVACSYCSGLGSTRVPFVRGSVPNPYSLALHECACRCAACVCFVCVCACVRACACVCVRVHACACVCVPPSCAKATFHDILHTLRYRMVLSFACARAHTRAREHTHTHIHTHVQGCTCS